MPSNRSAMVPSSVIASVETQGEAQSTVDYLWACGLREGLSIVGAELRLTDSSPARAGTIARCTGVDAGQGAALGFLMAMLVASFTQTNANGLVVVMWGLLYGALVGALRGFFRGLSKSRPDLVAQRIVPTRFEVRCAPQDESVALHLLAMRHRTAATPSAHASTSTAAAEHSRGLSRVAADDGRLSDAA